MNWQVPLSDLDFGEEEEKAVLEVLRSKWLTMGAVTQEFEEKFAQSTGSRYAFAVSNATEALHLACKALGIGPGDEVITPSLSFVATSNAVLYCGAKVVFADITSPKDLTIDPQEIARKITSRTKAIMVMHYAGYPCDMPAIMEIAAKAGLPVIEDTAHAPGASLDGKAMGTWGAAGCFSFFSNKNLITGEGGMLVTDREDVADKVRLMRSHGMTTLTYDRHKGHAYTYDVVDLGYNYRIDEIRSSLGVVQLKKLAQNNARRRVWTQRYWENLAKTEIGLPFNPSRGESACHIFPIILPSDVDRKAFIDALRTEGIQSSIHYPPTHMFTYYRSEFGAVSLPITEAVAAHELTLPLFPTMSAEMVDLVCEVVIRTLNTLHSKG